MRKDFGNKPLTYPQPVYILGTYDENGTANAMSAAWGGVCDFDKLYFGLSLDHKTVKNFKKTKALTVSMATVDTVTACDYIGLVSGNKVEDKVKRAGLTPFKASKVNAPFFKELPLALECQVENFDEKTGILTAKIVSVSADESVLTDGKVDMAKLRPITFDPFNMAYLEVGKNVGKAYSDGKKLMK